MQGFADTGLIEIGRSLGMISHSYTDQSLSILSSRPTSIGAIAPIHVGLTISTSKEKQSSSEIINFWIQE
jgi:hypothetical protein